MVSFIRQEYGDYFTIAVAGYPIPHSESISAEDDIRNLKAKVDAGADVIITQLFFEAQHFIDFITRCRQIGITIPIIPGIFSLNSYQSILKMSSLTGVPIPDRILQDLEPIKDNDEAVRNYGVDYLVNLCQNIIRANISPGLHFYTMNQDIVIHVLKRIGLWKKQQIKSLPWKVATNHRRVGERTRSIFWMNRPKSYIYRTDHWKTYPSGYWSIEFSKQISNSLEGYYSFLEIYTMKDELDQFLSGDMISLTNVYQIFYSFYSKYSNVINNNNDLNRVYNNSSSKEKKSISTIPWVQQVKKYFIGKIIT